MVEGHCLQAIKIVHHYVNSCADWLISGQKRVNPLRESISVLSGKYKRFTCVHPVVGSQILSLEAILNDKPFKFFRHDRVSQKFAIIWGTVNCCLAA